MKSNRLIIIGLFLISLVTSVAQAEVFYIDDDLESGFNIVDPEGVNYWYVRWPGSTPWALTTAQSHSATHSVLSNPTNSNEFFSGAPGALGIWTGERTWYEVWLRLDNTETAGWEDVAIWQNPSPLTYAPLVSVSRSSSGNFRYRASYETGLDAWIDTGIAYQTGVWYHLGWDMNPADSSFLLYISTGDFTAPVASGSYSSVPAWLGSMYFSSWSANPEYYIDDVKIVGDFQPLPICGDVDHPYPPGDLTLDCYVNLADLALFAANWQDCTEPNAPCNYIPPAP